MLQCVRREWIHHKDLIIRSELTQLCSIKFVLIAICDLYTVLLRSILLYKWQQDFMNMHVKECCHFRINA